MPSFDSILIANRGEIAVRVIRSARALGLRTIAVYSDADAHAPHVTLAHEAVRLGPAPVAESYLDAERLLAAAVESEADAIHPGYGFLSENAAFARACAARGLIFIGPPPDAIDLMGNKAEAKRRMLEAGVPCVPGYQDPDQSDAAFLAAAQTIGFPVMVKAAAGGGGRGMRLVDDPTSLRDALALARSEAANAFGSDELILEKAIMRPRHVELQVFADGQGTVLHLGERDCSVQRRHQKVIEEAPCPVMTPDLRERMGAAAVDAARSIGYRGAGTVEFLLDADGAFYFLEMNTRLQVEHPVTEMITGLDLVALQIQVAQGLPLGRTQEDVHLSGHAMEVRLYAEDPAQGFLPATGRVHLWSTPDGEGVRVDAGIVSGQEISPFYDPMVAKIIAWGETRDMARQRLRMALEETVLIGPQTNQAFLATCLARDTFAAGAATTAFIAEEFSAEDLAAKAPPPDAAVAAAVVQFLRAQDHALTASVHVVPGLAGWSHSGVLVSRYQYEFGETSYDLILHPHTDGQILVRHGEDVLPVTILERDHAQAVLSIAGRRYRVAFVAQGDAVVHLAMGTQTMRFENRIATAGLSEEAGGSGDVRAPMHGKVLEIFVTEGSVVEAGARLAVLEAMKMQHELVADLGGTVRTIRVAAGTQVGADDVLIEIEAEGTDG